MKFEIICRNNDIRLENCYFLLKVTEDCVLELKMRGYAEVHDVECKKGQYVLFCQNNKYPVHSEKFYIEDSYAKILIEKYNESVEEYVEGVENYLSLNWIE